MELGLAVGTVWLLYRNSSAPNSLQNTSILVAGILPALIAILPYLRSNVLQCEYRYALFFDEAAKKVVNTGFSHPYSIAYSSIFSNLNADDLSSREIEDDEIPKVFAKEYWRFFLKERGLDLVERAVLLQLAGTFTRHWDIHWTKKKTPAGLSFQGRYEDSPDGEEVQMAELHHRFSHNSLIHDKWVELVPPWLRIPPNSRITTSQVNVAGKTQRRITISNSEAELHVTISVAGGSVAEQGIWGFSSGMEGLRVLEYRVEAEMTLGYAKNNSQSAT